MRSIKSIFALVAVLVVMLASAAPALADGWWDDCDWYWSPWWGWFAACDSPPWWGGDDLSWDDIDDDRGDSLSWNDVG